MPKYDIRWVVEYTLPDKTPQRLAELALNVADVAGFSCTNIQDGLLLLVPTPLRPAIQMSPNFYNSVLRHFHPPGAGPAVVYIGNLDTAITVPLTDERGPFTAIILPNTLGLVLQSTELLKSAQSLFESLEDAVRCATLKRHVTERSPKKEATFAADTECGMVPALAAQPRGAFFEPISSEDEVSRAESYLEAVQQELPPKPRVQFSLSTLERDKQRVDLGQSRKEKLAKIRTRPRSSICPCTIS